jgi:carnitine monooxygenase subunit
VDEVCLRSFCARMRSVIPESALEQAPAHGWSRG